MGMFESLGTAVEAIFANKLRSALTMLGVVIGVGSVIAMVGIGEGTKKKSLENISQMGSNMITVMPDWRRGSTSMGSANASLREEDIEDLKRNVPSLT